MGSIEGENQPPRKFILTPEQLAVFQESNTYREIISYIETLNDAVVGVPLRRECSESEVRSRMAMLHLIKIDKRHERASKVF